MICELVKEQLVLTKTITATNELEFEQQLKALLIESMPYTGIVYVWKTQLDIPRLKGKSSVVYIGKANGNMYSRYISNVQHEIKEYWKRYSYIISTYGFMQVEIFVTNNPAITENNFLYQYHQAHMELPPINLQSYKSHLINKSHPVEIIAT